MDQYLSLSELAQRLGLALSTVSKYCKRYHQFIETRQEGRHKLYAPKTIDLLLKVNHAYKNRLSTEQIKKQIQTELAQKNIEQPLVQAAATVTSAKPLPKPEKEAPTALSAVRVDEIRSDLKRLQEQQEESLKLMTELEEQYRRFNPFNRLRD